MEELKGFIENYIVYLEKKGYSKNTIKNYEINLRYFYSFCKTFEVDFKEIKGSQMMKYIDVMGKYKSSTINIRLSSLKSFYEYLINMDIALNNPVRKSLYIRKNRKKPKPLTKRQEIYFLQYIEGKSEHIQLAFKTLIETGIRLSELKQLKEENFIEVNNKYYIEVLESKNQTNRIVPISSVLYNSILKYISSSVFYGNIFVLSNRAYQYYADMFSKEYDFKFSIHSLRHTYATRKSQEGLPIQIIQKLLGHKDISTTMYYVEVSDQDILDL